MTAVSVARIVEDPEEIEAEAGRRSKVIEVPEGAEWNAVEDVMLRRRSIRTSAARCRRM
jgi:predicted component of type VI protein secretion system